MNPIAVFAYNRPMHLQALLESLSGCHRLDECRVTIFCDGPKDESGQAAVEETRKTARDWVARHGGMVSARETNLGLARSITSGVSELCEEAGRVIVLEDDLLLHPRFLEFMLAALDRYQDEEKVYQISGFIFDAPQPSEPDAFFLPFTYSWGWATWRRAWRAFDLNMELDRLPIGDRKWRRRFDLNGCFHFSDLVDKRRQGRGDMWAIYWYIAVFQKLGLALYPRVSLVANNGFDGSGVHCGARPRYGIATNWSPEWPSFPSAVKWPSQVEVDQAAFRRVQKFLRGQEKLWRQRPSLLARIRGGISPFAPEWLKAALRSTRAKRERPGNGKP